MISRVVTPRSTPKTLAATPNAAAVSETPVEPSPKKGSMPPALVPGALPRYSSVWSPRPMPIEPPNQRRPEVRLMCVPFFPNRLKPICIPPAPASAGCVRNRSESPDPRAGAPSPTARAPTGSSTTPGSRPGVCPERVAGAVPQARVSRTALIGRATVRKRVAAESWLATCMKLRDRGMCRGALSVRPQTRGYCDGEWRRCNSTPVNPGSARLQPAHDQMVSNAFGRGNERHFI